MWAKVQKVAVRSKIRHFQPGFSPGGLAPKVEPQSPVSLPSVVVPKGAYATAQTVRLTRVRFRRNLNFSEIFRRPISPEPYVMYFRLDIFPEAVAEV